MIEDQIDTRAGWRPQDLSYRFEQELAEVTAELRELERLATAKGKRRGAHSLTSKDPQKYRLGSIFWVLAENFKELDDLALLGLLSWGPKTLQLLAEFSRAEDENLLQPIMRIMADKDLYLSLRQRGGFLRWEKCRALYIADVEGFERSAAAQNPNARWRRKPPTKNQLYLIAEAVRCFELPPPAICTRGDAHGWLRDNGGNPRFANPPRIAE
ncbi:hypothetical protein [Qipengyuania flava]|uniref:hypothetical protein n=1 Tax=Qipengyuania flava TaxID=192812 RepID=UPI001CFEDA7D|nr:hypothetical protein [Qipengyuania flava]